MARTYAVTVGTVLFLLGVLGLFKMRVFGLEFHPAHNVIHLASGLPGLWAGIRNDKFSRAYAQVFGAVYTVVAVAGFVGIGSMQLGLTGAYNIFHLLLGVGGLGLGLTGGKRETEQVRAAGA
jgi:hypothetical protein